MFSTAVCLFLILVTVAVVTTWMKGGAEGFVSREEKTYWWMNGDDTTDSRAETYAKEGFETSPLSLMPEHSPVLEFVPDGPSPVDLYNKQAYLLLEDAKPAASADVIKNQIVTAQACYTADFENQLSKLGSYRQMTNNYKRELPDNCSTLNKDMSLNFYGS